MDKFYVVRVKWLKDGSIKKSELMSYETQNQAIAKFHANLGADMGDETLSGSMCTVLNQLGESITSNYWGHITVIEEQSTEEA